MIRAAVIDIGTNSVKLSVADVSSDVAVIHEESRITRLGKKVDSDGRLNAEAVQKTLVAVQDFVDTARRLGAVRIVGAGTSALRDASNGGELLKAVQDTRGLLVEIISGEREASLAYKAVAEDPEISGDAANTLLVFDIGGGSTELVFGSGGVMMRNVSLKVGAVRLTERHLHTDPPTDREVAVATLESSEPIDRFAEDIPAVAAVYGVGGTAVTLASIALSTGDVHGRSVDIDLVRSCAARLRAMTLSQRREVQFLEPDRADIIVAGASILLALLEAFHATSYKVSMRGMRYGLLLEQKS